MHTTLLIGLGAAVATALLTNLAFLLKHRGACQAPAVCFGSPLTSAKNLLTNRTFALGMAIAALGFAAHAAAMALAPLSLIKPVIAGGLVFLAVLAERYFGASLTRKQWGGVILVGLGLMMLVLTAPGREAKSYSPDSLLPFQAGMMLLGGFLVMVARAERVKSHAGMLLGAATGILFGASDIAIKALSDMRLENLLSSPWVLFCLFCAVVAFLLGAKSLQLGEAVPTIATTCLTSNLTCIVGGFLVFADPLPSSPLALTGNIIALAMILSAAVLVPAPTRAVEPVPA